MLIFCSFCSLPSQSQGPDSLLRFCSEALFGAQRQVVLPLRGCFQALLSGCTILSIISCSSFALSRSTWADQGAHRERCWFCICLGHVQDSTALQPFPTRKASCASFAQWQVPTPSSGLQHLHLMWCVLQQQFRKCSAICTMASGGLVGIFTILCFVPCSQGLLRNVDDSSGGVPLGTAFLPPLPIPSFVFC